MTSSFSSSPSSSPYSSVPAAPAPASSSPVSSPIDQNRVRSLVRRLGHLYNSGVRPPMPERENGWSMSGWLSTVELMLTAAEDGWRVNTRLLIRIETRLKRAKALAEQAIKNHVDGTVPLNAAQLKCVNDAATMLTALLTEIDKMAAPARVRNGSGRVARDDAHSAHELCQGVVLMATAMPTIEGAIGDAIREQLAAVGVTDIRRGHGKRFWEAVCVEATLDDASYLASIKAQIAKMREDGFERVEGWYAFLDRELSAFGLEQTGGPIAGALGLARNYQHERLFAKSCDGAFDDGAFEPWNRG